MLAPHPPRRRPALTRAPFPAVLATRESAPSAEVAPVDSRSPSTGATWPYRGRPAFQACRHRAIASASLLLGGSQSMAGTGLMDLAGHGRRRGLRALRGLD